MDRRIGASSAVMRSWFPAEWAGLRLRDRGRSSTIRGGGGLHHPGGARSRAAAPPHRKESAEVVPLVRMPPGRRPRVRTRTLWRDYIYQLAPSRSWRGSLGRGMDGFPSWTCWFCDPTSDKRKMMMTRSMNSSEPFLGQKPLLIRYHYAA